MEQKDKPVLLDDEELKQLNLSWYGAGSLGGRMSNHKLDDYLAEIWAPGWII